MARSGRNQDQARLSGHPGQTLSETVYQTLLQQLLYGELGGVDRLLPGEIAARFGVSPAPVREALTRLALEGYIEAIPRRGFHVRRPAWQQLVDTWQLRLGLELIGGEIAIARLRDGSLSVDEVDALLPLQRKLAALHRPSAHQRHSELNAEFHRRIIALSGNRMLVAVYDSVQMHVLRAWIQRGSSGWTGRIESEAREHAVILAALRAADVEAYAKATRAHLARSLRDAADELDDKAQAPIPTAQDRGR